MVSRLVETKASLLNQDSRIEQHRANFETLKGEFLSLQRQHDGLKDEYSDLSRNYVQVTEKSEEVIKKLQDERDLKIVECEQLRAEILTPSQMMDLKEAIAAEAEDMYRKQLESLEVELHVLRNDHKKICKNYEYLRAEHDSLQVNHENRIKEIKLRLQNEVSEYRDRCKELSGRLERDIPNELQKIRQLQRENTELSERNYALLSENDQLKALMDTTDTSKEQHAFALSQEISELKATLSHISNSKTSLENQNKHLQNEIESQAQVNQSLTKQLLDYQREVKVWTRKHDSCLHEHSREIDTLKRRQVQELQLNQEERRKHCEELEQCRVENETLELAMKQLETVIAEKDKELSAAVEKAVESEWQRRVNVEKERMSLEGKLAETQRSLLTHSEEYERAVGEYKDQVASMHTDKSLLEAELQSLKNELVQKNAICAQSSKDQLELKDLKNKVSSFMNDKLRLEECIKELEEESGALLTKNQLLSQQVQSLQSEISQISERHLKDMDKFRSELGEERTSWKNRVDDIVSQKKSLEEKLASVKTKRRKLQKEHQRSIQEVERLLELAHENEKQAIVEKEKIRKSADEEIKSLKCQIKTVRKQHRQFLTIMNRSPEMPNFNMVEIDAELSTTTLLD